MSKDELIKLVQEFKNGDQSKFEDIYLATNKTPKIIYLHNMIQAVFCDNFFIIISFL